MVNCSKLRKVQCESERLYCKWVRAKGCQSLGTQRKPKVKKETTEKTVPKVKKETTEKTVPKPKKETTEKTVPKVKLYKKGTKLPVFVDSGTYGCVVSPPLETTSSKTIIPYTNASNKDIGKVFKDNDDAFSYELDILTKIVKMDPDNIFTIQLKGAMLIPANLSTIGRVPELRSCLAEGDGEETYYPQIVLENGGVSIANKNYLTDEKWTLTYMDFLLSFKTFLQGMAEMQSNNMVHCDIKPQNVLISKEKKISLIDFGLLQNANNVFSKSNIRVLGFLEYQFYPPEFFIAYVFLKSKDAQTIYPDDLRALFNQNFLLSNQSLLEKYKKGVYEFLEVFSKMKTSKGRRNIFSPKMALKGDVFGLAYIIAALNKRIVGATQTEKEFIANIFSQCRQTNPFNRISVPELLQLVTVEFQNQQILQSSVQQKTKEIVGGKLIKTECDKVSTKMFEYVQNH